MTQAQPTEWASSIFLHLAKTLGIISSQELCIIYIFVFQTPGDYYVLHYIAKILELIVPLMEHPSESFLAQLEEDMMKLILKHGMMVIMFEH